MNDKNKNILQDLIIQILDTARSQGAMQAEADIGTGAGLSVTVRRGEVEKIEHERDKGLSVTVYMDKRKGSASTSDFSDQAINKTVEAACNIARNTSQDECAGLVDLDLIAKEVPDLDLHHPWEITPDQAIETAIECETHARNFDQRINNSDGAVVSTYSGSHIYGNTHDFVNGWDWSSHTIDCTMIAEDAGNMQRDGWYSKARDHNDLQNIKAIGTEAAQRTVQRLGAKKLSTRNVPVIFEAPVASGLFSALITAISGGSLYRRASFLLDKLGEQIFAEHIHIHEQPHLKKALGSAPFDNDGVATKQRDIIKDGILQGYALSAYSARKLGMQTTGNAGGVHNLIVEPGKHNLDELIEEMDTGLLITDMIGFGVNQITGDYSRGASGFWIEHAKIQHPVEEITVAGNLSEMYKQILAIGNDVDPRGNILTGSVLIENMTIAGD
ncbi:MAG: metalloprotease PmbA [Gammaproteobacteria bacterium]